MSNPATNAYYNTRDKWMPNAVGALVVDPNNLPVLSPGQFVPLLVDYNTGNLLVEGTSGGGGGGGTPSNPSYIAATPGTLTDRSGTITTGGVAQTAVLANTSRKYLLVQNPTSASTSFWISFTGTAVNSSPSIEIAPGVTITYESSFVPTQAISVNSTVSQVFTIKEGQ